MSVATEAAHIRDLFETIEELESVASSLAEDDERRTEKNAADEKDGRRHEDPLVAGSAGP